MLNVGGSQMSFNMPKIDFSNTFKNMPKLDLKPKTDQDIYKGALSTYSQELKSSQISPQQLSGALAQSNKQARQGWDSAVSQANQGISTFKSAMDTATSNYSRTAAEAQARMEAAQNLANQQAQQSASFLMDQARTVNDYFSQRFDPELQRVQGATRTSFEEADRYLRGFRGVYDKALQGQLSLSDAMRVHEPTRQEFEKLGQQFVDASEQQLASQRQQSLADYGALAALGGQAMRQVGRATTGGAEALRQQAAQSQASQAYQNALARMNAIRDQQLAYQARMRETGLQQGLAQSQWGYQAGLQAANQAQQSDIARQQLYASGQQQLANLAALGQQMRNQASQLSGALSQDAFNVLQGAASGETALGQATSAMQGNLANMQMSGAGQLAGLYNQLGALQAQRGADLAQRSLTESLAPLALQQKNVRELADISLQKELGALGMSRADRLSAEEKALARELANKQMAAARAQRQGGLLSLGLGILGTGIGALYGGPTGATIGGGLGSLAGSLLGG